MTNYTDEEIENLMFELQEDPNEEHPYYKAMKQLMAERDWTARQLKNERNRGDRFAVDFWRIEQENKRLREALLGSLYFFIEEDDDDDLDGSIYKEDKHPSECALIHGYSQEGVYVCRCSREVGLLINTMNQNIKQALPTTEDKGSNDG